MKERAHALPNPGGGVQGGEWLGLTPLNKKGRRESFTVPPRASSLRWYDPDQVRRSVAAATLSARQAGLPCCPFSRVS